MASCWLYEFQKAQVKVRLPEAQTERNLFKLNVDASVFACHHSIGFGELIRDSTVAIGSGWWKAVRAISLSCGEADGLASLLVGRDKEWGLLDIYHGVDRRREREAGCQWGAREIDMLKRNTSEQETYSMEGILERYERYSYAERQLLSNDPEPNGSWSLEHAKLKARMDVLQRNQKHFLGEELDSLTLKELQNLEQQLDSALKHTRSRKDKALQEQNNLLTKQMKEKEKELAEQTQLGQQNHNLEVSSILLAQPNQSLNVGVSCSPRSDGLAEDEATQHQNRGNALLPSWMLNNLNA
ncbi:Agamous-like MADS-box protein AGL8-like protein [Morus notabilis]|uniref:Agamous-like MADS-box protein AGL8-like protein n=1 Tax=Morus notabilis TaxID=981085 RepID=W9RP40_9ROSA|nr:Agamous-like MADS-box protein AGL8-like protein [Morus notabilis]